VAYQVGTGRQRPRAFARAGTDARKVPRYSGTSRQENGTRWPTCRLRDTLSHLRCANERFSDTSALPQFTAGMLEHRPPMLQGKVRANPAPGDASAWQSSARRAMAIQTSDRAKSSGTLHHHGKSIGLPESGDTSRTN